MIFILAALIILTSPDLLFRQILLPGITVTGSEDTPYGNITYGEYHGEKSTYYNQRLLPIIMMWLNVRKIFIMLCFRVILPKK